MFNFSEKIPVGESCKKTGIADQKGTCYFSMIGAANSGKTLNYVPLPLWNQFGVDCEHKC